MRRSLLTTAVLSSLASAGAIPWTDPGSASWEWSPAVHEARGALLEYRSAQTSLTTRFENPGEEGALSLLSGLDFSGQVRYGAVQVPILVRWNHWSTGAEIPLYGWRKGNDGKSNAGLGDIWMHAGWGAGDSALSGEVSLLLKAPSGQENPSDGAALGTGSWDGGIQGLLRTTLGHQLQLGVGATAILTGEEQLKVDSSGTVIKRRYDPGDFLSLQALVRHKTTSWMDLGMDVNLTHQGRGMVAYDSTARPLAPITQLALEPLVKLHRWGGDLSFGMSLPVATSLEVSWTPTFKVGMHFGFSTARKAHVEPEILPLQLAPAPPPAPEAKPEPRKGKGKKRHEEPKPAPAPVTAPVPEPEAKPAEAPVPAVDSAKAPAAKADSATVPATDSAKAPAAKPDSAAAPAAN